MSHPREQRDRVTTGYGLSEAVYSLGYRLRLQYSSFQPATIQWLLDHSDELIATDRPSVLSLGCGDGAFDMKIIERLQETKGEWHFSGLDFNATDLERFRNRLSSQDRAIRDRVALHYRKYDASSQLGRRFDFIYMVHFLQSFDDPLPVIRNTLAHLGPNGRLLIVQQKRQGIYELRQKFREVLTNQKFHSSEEIEKSLRETGIPFSSHTIDSRFDISILRQRSLDALLLMSFCFTNDLAKLDSVRQEEIRQAFLDYATMGPHGTPIIHEPMEAIVCEAL